MSSEIVILGGDDVEAGGEDCQYRDSLERADFSEKLCRFERLTSSSGDRRPPSRPSSAPLSTAARHSSRHSGPIVSCDSAPAVTVPASRGWTRRGHRVGVVETPTGDVDLDPGRRLNGAPVPHVQLPDDVTRNGVSSSVPSRQSLEEAPPPLKPSSAKRPHDRLHDVRAAILASAAAKLSSPTGSVSSPRPNTVSSDWLQAAKRGTGSHGQHVAECRIISDVENGTDASSDSGSRLLRQSDEQSSSSTHSSASSRSEVLPTTQKPPTGRTLSDSVRSSKQTDRRNFDKASSFFRSLLNRPRSPSPNRENNSRSPTSGKRAPPRELDGTSDQNSGTIQIADNTSLVSSPSSRDYFAVTCPESLTLVDNSAAKSVVLDNRKFRSFSGTSVDTADKSSRSEYSKETANGTLLNSGSGQREKLSTPVAATSAFVVTDIGKNSACVDFVSSHHPQSADTALSSLDRRLHSTAEIVIGANAAVKPDLKRGELELGGVDTSPHQNKKARKAVTFSAEVQNTGGGLSSVGVVELPVTMNGDVQVESEKPTNNNTVAGSRLTAGENVPLTSTSRYVLGELDITHDVSNANVMQSCGETETALVGSGNFDLVHTSASVGLSDAQKSVVTVNGCGHEVGEPPATEGDDTASVSDLDSEDMSASQQDLCVLYQQRRAERLQEQRAAELEKQRLEEILKLCTEFGLSSDVPSSLLAGDEIGGADAEEKSERRNSLGRIKTNGSLSKLAGLPLSDPALAVERQLNRSGSGSDDDVDHGTVRRRPLTAKRLANASAVAAPNNTLPVTVASDRTAGEADKLSRTPLARTGSGSLPTVGLSVESAGRSKSVPMIDTNMSLGDGELDRLLQSNIDFSLPTAADWRVGETNCRGILKSSFDWYSASLPEYSAIWDSVSTWKSSQHRVSTSVSCQ